MVVRIIQGSLRGKRWVVGSSTHGCWLGSYEYAKQRLFEQSVRSGDIVYDIGAHTGFYTLLASVLVGSTGRVVAFEPLPRNLAYLRKHLALNHVRNTVVMEGAVCENEGEVRIVAGLNSSETRVDAKGTMSVRALTIDHLIFRDGFPAPTVIKIDVEGAEHAVLRGGIQLLTEKRPLIFLSTHGPQLHTEYCRLLTGLGYTLQPEIGDNIELCSEVVGR
ncbi:MAG: FkbM family methyltransferase [candidate division NC10 bacterium]|nr:FkbM family methyltransferase [candidate division NC10 bacterium]MDE2320352.1 FkbM family methyltransferase [candidate division NC10 bacterium]